MKAQIFAPNHLTLADETSFSLQSYDTIVVRKEGDTVYLDPAWNISATTAKNVYKFLFTYVHFDDMNKKSVTKLIENGRFIVKNLN